MSYTTDRAGALAKQLERFAHAHLHQVAGQVANLEFWLDEVEHAIRTIDDYPRRFRRLRDAQVAWVQAHGTKVDVPCAICGGACEFGPQPPLVPKRISSDVMDDARGALRGAALRFLLRCYRANLIDEAAVRSASDRLQLSLEADDLDRSPRSREWA